MKSTAAKPKQATKSPAKAASRTEPVRRVEKATRVERETPRVQAATPRPAAPAADASTPMPDLTAFQVPQRDAQAHVAQCEPCGRAYRHVVKNPKDAMALQSFGKNIASCLAVNAERS
jgi:hypothetical protein